MVRQISLVLGIGALLTICTHPVQAEPVQRSSRGSLNTLEGRSTEKDAEVFFPGLPQSNMPSYPENTVGNESRQKTKFRLWGEDVNVDVGDYLRNDDVYLDPSIAPGDAPDNGKVRFLINLDEWNR
ncbi:hypothetical protein HC931_21970 [Candidatus Gracilibacteria bacterium]|jgi:hypothetical protein|nr:hypothetical protein [Candidatus Gracilibacteria bacterium]NJM88256.1 hypothetical protein [Hydrococcus sp. RU_2_2]NJP18155.1 hypothetical protein [Hydrococcus sp. CRU_1_1]NJQ97066.1 hypothetical protein [Hydrococcus sp. CSU_1_8]